MYVAIGKRIRRLRKKQGFTQEKLAEAAEISLSFLGHIERGTRKASVDTLVKLCNALSISPNLLLQDSLSDNLLGGSDDLSPSQRRLLREIQIQVINYTGELQNAAEKLEE